MLALSRAILCHEHANRRRLFPPQISCIPCSSSLPPIDRSTSRLQLICLFAHNRYGATIPGRLFTSAALKHLASDDSELPHLMLHRGSAMVPECNNPDLIPGIYPMLFRWVRHSGSNLFVCQPSEIVPRIGASVILLPPLILVFPRATRNLQTAPKYWQFVFDHVQVIDEIKDFCD